MVVSVLTLIPKLGQELRSDSTEANVKNQSRTGECHGSPTRRR